MTVVRDVTLRQHGNREELERYLSYRGIRVVGEDVAANALFYEVDIPCSQLTEDNGCKVHDSPEKPLLVPQIPPTRRTILRSAVIPLNDQPRWNAFHDRTHH